MTLDKWASIATIAGGVAVIFSAGAWALKNWLKNYLQELKPNGGGSMADSIKRIEARIDYLTEAMMDHLKGHE